MGDSKDVITQGKGASTNDSSSDQKDTSFWDDVKSVGSLIGDSWSYSSDNYDPTLNRVGRGLAAGTAGGTIVGAGTAAAVGAAGGTLVVPGVGTAVGAAGAGLIGGVAGGVIGGTAGVIDAVTNETDKQAEKDSRRMDAFMGRINPNEGKEEALEALKKIGPEVHAVKTNPHCICNDPICTENAIIQCAWGSAFAKLHVVAPKRTLIGKFKNRVVIPADVLAGANMEGFGACWNLANPLTLELTIAASALAQKFVWTPSPCTASIAPTPWLPTQTTGIQLPVPVVTQKSVCVCWGMGIISFIDNGQNNNAAPVRFDCGNWKENAHNAIKLATFGLGGVASLASVVTKVAKAVEAVNAAKIATAMKITSVTTDSLSAAATVVDGGIYLSEGKKFEAIMSFAMSGLGALGTAGGIRSIARGDDAIAVTKQIAKRRDAVIKLAEAKTPTAFKSLLKETDDGLLTAMKNTTAKGSKTSVGNKMTSLTNKSAELDENLAKVGALNRAKGNLQTSSSTLSKEIKTRDAIVGVMDGLQKERATAAGDLATKITEQTKAKDALSKADAAYEAARAENAAALKKYVNGEISQTEWLEASKKFGDAEDALKGAKEALTKADDAVDNAKRAVEVLDDQIDKVGNQLTQANGRVIDAMDNYNKVYSQTSGIISQKDDIIKHANEVMGERDAIIKAIQEDLLISSNNKISHGLDVADDVNGNVFVSGIKGAAEQYGMTNAIIYDNEDLVNLINNPDQRTFSLDDDAVAQLNADDDMNNNLTQQQVQQIMSYDDTKPWLDLTLDNSNGNNK